MSGTDQQYRVTPGLPEPRGVTASGGGVNVAVHSAFAEVIEFCLFDDTGTHETARLRLPDRTGDVFHAHIHGVGLGARYGLRAHGPYDPHAGHRFNPAKLLVDPYALAIDRPFVLSPALFGFEPATGRPDGTDSASAMPKGVVTAPTAAAPWTQALPWDRVVIAELHVRGFTKLHPGVPEAVRGTFAGLAAPAAVAHLKALGITTVELLPAAASLDERHLQRLGLSNYWNYNPVAFLAPDPRLAPGGWDEIRAATATLNAAGIEVILDVVYNHSGESDAEGPTVSLRGLDNASYYRLDAADPARYVDDAGCGNILAADHPAVVRLVMDSLRAWARFGGINGFRFDLATTLGRRRSGFEAGAPLIGAIEQDPALQGLRMIAEPWDIGPGGYQVGAFSGRWGEWNDKYRDDVRRFWRGDGTIADLATRVAGSTDRFWFKRKPSRSVNFVTAHDGFTLADLVSYSGKHNQANGEDNRDGTNDNHSWNNGVEGPTNDPTILEARRRDQRNLLATLLLSRGTPMLGPGSETGQTQHGNNNAYAQDNPLSWIDWATPDGDLAGFVARLTGLRAVNPALTHDRFLTGGDADGLGFPDVVWRLADGTPPAQAWSDPAHSTLVAELTAPAGDGLNRVVAVFHAGRGATTLLLPEARRGCVWRLALDTGTPRPAPEQLFDGETEVPVAPRTVLLFVEESGAIAGGRRRVVAAEVLDRLATAAGIAPEWFEMNGARHPVQPDSKRALLAAMGLGVGSSGEARDSLEELAETRDRRRLPRSLPTRAGRPISLRVADLPETGGRLELTVHRDDGTTHALPIDLSRLERRIVTACDGRTVHVTDVPVPAQPIGRHRIVLGGAEDRACALTVAPERSFLPDDLAAGGRAFGIAAHLYTLRGASDCGIGDFGVLGEFAEASGRHGAGLVGINPIHALFNGNRERASPYHPSDRRFLDPIYIELGPDILGEAAEVQAGFTAEAQTFADLRALALVDYTRVWAAKRQILEVAFKAFDLRAARRPADADIRHHAAFVTEGGDTLQNFAVFQAISDTIPDRDWMGWPEPLRHPDGPGAKAFAATQGERVRFHLYLQWIAERQLALAAERGRAGGLGIGLYRDLAVGTAPDGAEAWSEQEAYARGVSVGSPPDPFSATGQIWCLPPPNPMGRTGPTAGLLGPLLSANMRHAGALRIDHAMGLSRLFWVPDGASGSAGAYVGYDFEANLAEVAIESHRARCVVIGEDLGTVQDGFRETLDRNDILSYRVLFFEREGLAFKPAHTYPRSAVACVATHDIAPLAGWWAGHDIVEREAVGQLDEAGAATASVDRAVEREKLAEAVGSQGPAATAGEAVDALTRSVHRFIADTPSMLVVAQADDLIGEQVAVNLPGTDRERPNWRRRLPLATAELFEEVDRRQVLPTLPLKPAR